MCAHSCHREHAFGAGASIGGGAEILGQISTCSKQYLENKCTPVETRLPAMETLCVTWEKYPLPAFSAARVASVGMAGQNARGTP